MYHNRSGLDGLAAALLSDQPEGAGGRGSECPKLINEKSQSPVSDWLFGILFILLCPGRDSNSQGTSPNGF